jgi:hypothetical protein
LTRWSKNFLRQFCHALDHCCVGLHWMRFFQFASKLFKLFFDIMVHATQPLVSYFHTRPMLDVLICMWGKLILKKFQFEYPISMVGSDVHHLLASEYNIFHDIEKYIYTWEDWRGCPNIRFI